MKETVRNNEEENERERDGGKESEVGENRREIEK